MRAVVTRVSSASVSVAGEVVGAIDAGLLVLIGVTHSDDDSVAEALASKIANLRILRDGSRDESSALELGAPVLVISQFTLYADVRKGRRPSWTQAAPGPVAEPLVATVVDRLRELGLRVETGHFGADMAVSSTNDVPVTIVLQLP